MGFTWPLYWTSFHTYSALPCVLPFFNTLPCFVLRFSLCFTECLSGYPLFDPFLHSAMFCPTFLPLFYPVLHFAMFCSTFYPFVLPCFTLCHVLFYVLPFCFTLFYTLPCFVLRFTLLFYPVLHSAMFCSTFYPLFYPVLHSAMFCPSF